MTKIVIDKALIEQALISLEIGDQFNPGLARATLRTALAKPVVETDDPLHCDLCGDATDDPWHFSTSQDRHKHACDKCWESKKALRAALAPVAVEPVWNGKLSDAMQKALNALHLECPPEVVSEIAFRVRQECEAIYTSYITVKRMYHAARDELEARDTKAEELKSALAELVVEPVAWLYDFTIAGDNEAYANWVTQDPTEVGKEVEGISNVRPLYASPPPPAEAPLLTNELIDTLADAHRSVLNGSPYFAWYDYARKIEQAVRQKAGLV